MTTPFDMLVLNRTSRYQLCIEALRRVPRLHDEARDLIDRCHEALEAHRKFVVERCEDMPAIRNWKWEPA
jgi:xylulose-5-phosphate/fructose-6-phosphate phosphoketolase